MSESVKMVRGRLFTNDLKAYRSDSDELLFIQDDVLSIYNSKNKDMLEIPLNKIQFTKDDIVAIGFVNYEVLDRRVCLFLLDTCELCIIFYDDIHIIKGNIVIHLPWTIVDLVSHKNLTLILTEDGQVREFTNLTDKKLSFVNSTMDLYNQVCTIIKEANEKGKRK